MKLKEFFKPDFAKLILFFIIEAITIVAYALPFILEVLIPFNFIISSFTNLASINPSDLASIQSSYGILGLVRFFDLLWHYTISCFIIWFYTKLKKK